MKKSQFLGTRTAVATAVVAVVVTAVGLQGSHAAESASERISNNVATQTATPSYVSSDAAATAALAAAASGVDSPDLQVDGASIVSSQPGVSAPRISPQGHVSVSTTAGGNVGISLLGASGTTGALANGALVQTDVYPDTHMVTQATEDGAQILGVLESPQAAHRLEFVVTMPAGGVLVPQPDGSVNIDAPIQVQQPLPGEDERITAEIEKIVGGTPAEQELTEAQVSAINAIPPAKTAPETTVGPIATIAPAWAKDANGFPVPTAYTMSGNRLNQIIKPASFTEYPIVADPAIGAVAAAAWCLKGAVSGLAGQVVADILNGKRSTWKSYLTNVAISCILGDIGGFVWRILPSAAKAAAIRAVFVFVLKFTGPRGRI